MFRSARIKLTIWYLAIIILISAFFSAIIYFETAHRLERSFYRAEIRLKAKELEDLPPRLKKPLPGFLLAEELQQAKRGLKLRLLVINGIILVLSTFAGYFLAGKTLRPIEKVLEQQKRFVADASHELRTPLTALKTSMEVALKDKKISLKEAKEVIKSNLEEIDRLQSLTDHLLNLTRLETNTQNIVFDWVDLSRVIKSASQKILPLARKKKLRIIMAVKKGKIWANKELLEEMMVIFLDNAVKYTPAEGRVRVKTTREKNYITISVEDTGIGIAQKDLPYLFDRFYRADQSRSKNKVPGFGLGLSLAKRIIEIHRGSVSVVSRLGKGSKFTIKLPIKS